MTGICVSTARAVLAAMDTVNQTVLESSVPHDVYLQWINARAILRVDLGWAESADTPVGKVPKHISEGATA